MQIASVTSGTFSSLRGTIGFKDIVIFTSATPLIRMALCAHPDQHNIRSHALIVQFFIHDFIALGLFTFLYQFDMQIHRARVCTCVFVRGHDGHCVFISHLAALS